MCSRCRNSISNQKIPGRRCDISPLNSAGRCARCLAHGCRSIPKTLRVWGSPPACCAWPPSSRRTPRLQSTSALVSSGSPRSSARRPCCPTATKVCISDFGMKELEKVSFIVKVFSFFSLCRSDRFQQLSTWRLQVWTHQHPGIPRRAHCRAAHQDRDGEFAHRPLTSWSSAFDTWIEQIKSRKVLMEQFLNPLERDLSQVSICFLELSPKPVQSKAKPRRPLRKSFSVIFMFLFWDENAVQFW